MASAADRLKEYEKLFQQSQLYDTSKFQSDFEKAYGEATNYNKDLIDSKAQAIGQAQALPNQLREQYYSSPIRNPLAQEALISTRRGNITSDITGLTDLLQARGARYQDVLRKYLAAYESEASRAQAAAENMWRMYQDALAQEEAARARAAAAAQRKQLEDLFKKTTQTEEGPREREIDTGSGWGWIDKALNSNWTGTDLSTGNLSAGNIGSFLLNPVWSTVKTGAGLLGNLMGNRNQSNMSFLDKLLDRK